MKTVNIFQDVDLVSIVVPIYGVEPYLKKCINSLLAQTYVNIEIILIDDGSPDCCGNICDQYKSLDNRIRVIHKENGGLSEARNFGIEIARGKYITFVDGDDYVSSDYVEYMHSLAIKCNADIAIGGFIKIVYQSSNMRVKHESVEVIDNKQALREMLYAKKFSTSAWGKLYLRELFRDVRYPDGKVLEDMFTTHKIFSKAKRIVYGSQICYYYLHRSGSILLSDSSNKYYCVAEGLEQLGQDIPIKEYGLENAYSSQIIECISVMFEGKPKPQTIKELGLWEKIRKHRYKVLTDPYAAKRVKGYAFLSYLGLRPMISVISKYYNLKWGIIKVIQRKSCEKFIFRIH